jgi:hypothetical protein
MGARSPYSRQYASSGSDYVRSLPLFPLTRISISIFLAHFSENWGYISLSPLFAGNFFSVAFGRNLDAHEREAATDNINDTSRFSSPSANSTIASVVRAPPLTGSQIQKPANLRDVVRLAAPECRQGRLCYVDTLYITVAACALALGLSVWAGLRDRRKLGVAAEKQRERRDVIGPVMFGSDD